MKIIFPELKNPITKEAINDFSDIEFIPANNLGDAVKILKEGKADSMISGLDYSSRDVLLAYKDNLPLKSIYFSSCFICEKENQHLALADGGVNKLPTKDQLYTIVEDTAKTFEAYYHETPKIAMLSYSTNGSGGNNPDLEKIQFVIKNIREKHSNWLIDGEMQLDAAIDSTISKKKYPTSILQGNANILITPDLNSGNILYKALERFGGWTCAGPIIQGFRIPLADLSRGSTIEDVKLTIKVLSKLCSDNPAESKKTTTTTPTQQASAQHFGTDGIRKKADEFTPELLAKIVRGLNGYAGDGYSVLLGGDTRESTERIIANLESILHQHNIRLATVDVLPTPAINYCFFEMGFDFAIDVTASHNPYQDNGIKIFERGERHGEKLGAAGKERIETSLNSPIDYSPSTEKSSEHLHDIALDLYKTHLKSYVGEAKFTGLNIGLDCANGATSVINKEVFEELGATVTLIHADENYSQKINDNCGSTHLESLQNLVIEKQLDLGIAFDGDGDRVIMVDKEGSVVDGDQIIAILADYLKLGSIVITVMSNQGLFNWASETKIHTEVTDVGDSNVFLAMQKTGIELGGEQSGHIILPNEPTGDGMLTALMVVKALSKTGKTLKELASIITKLPQVLLNLEATPEQKRKLTTSPDVIALLNHYNEIVKSFDGRLLVRPSGTENLIRITIWGNDKAAIEKLAGEIKTKLGEVL